MSQIELEAAKIVRVACNQLDAHAKNTVDLMKRTAARAFQEMLDEVMETASARMLSAADSSSLKVAEVTVPEPPTGHELKTIASQTLETLLDTFSERAESLFELELKPLINASFIRIAAEHEALFHQRLVEISEKIGRPVVTEPAATRPKPSRVSELAASVS